jgi:hypothetical protein
MQRTGIRVRFVRAIFVPEDDTWFYLYEADSAEVVQQAARRAALQFERIAETVTQIEGAASRSRTSASARCRSRVSSLSEQRGDPRC